MPDSRACADGDCAAGIASNAEVENERFIARDIEFCCVSSLSLCRLGAKTSSSLVSESMLAVFFFRGEIKTSTPELSLLTR
jgi:hypothetical protein